MSVEDPYKTNVGESANAGSNTIAHSPVAVPQQIGRYQIERVLGKGGFGTVYLARDEQLKRLVAIKVPHAELVSATADIEAYLSEARAVASLDHPNIVPVFDVGSTDQFPCFVVSKFIDGMDLADHLKQSRLSREEAAELVATVAEALHHAHIRGLVHRDIKPGNILLDRNGKSFVGDFGLALREEDVGKGPRYAGTPAYMSPEQARGEGHRVDGRSDIFSLGVVLYQLLAGRRPFKADTLNELLDQISNLEPRPLRQIDESIPKELERICFKAFSKRASERYLTASDMAEDLRHFLTDASVNSPSGPVSWSLVNRPTTGATQSAFQPLSQPGSVVELRRSSDGISVATPTSYGPSLKIVPKGLRSFDAHDADFFLELLPGPRDRSGLPDTIRFWKTRIEETDPEKTFPVGLICGPSGCGKSSLVKAALLPNLGENVQTVYVEATAKEAESRLLNGLRRRCSALPMNLGLKESLVAIRRGQGIPVGQKILIVIDQFEQWLHAHKEEQNSELVQALRQCDGTRVQCLVMVRDDFWMAVIRFMRELEIRLVDGHNSAAVDLFDVDHARKVLAAFGRAFGKLPESTGEMDAAQKEFVKQAASGLSQEGKVISVRLALFAEMMKGKPWTPATLKEVGGTQGVGLTFLEETFSAANAPPEHRYHQKGARAVLKALLPEAGTDIKGHMRSEQELLEASGYAARPKDFDDLIRILDSEIRLITPTDPEGADDAGDSPVLSGVKYYQLAHDYLVHSLREWLTRKQKETRRGRAELLLADRSAVWTARPETRQLPSLLQWLQISLLTSKSNRTPPERNMMRAARRFHSIRAAVVMVALTLVGWGVYETQGSAKARHLLDQLLVANIVDVPGIVNNMGPYRGWLNPLLVDAIQSADASKDPAKQRLHASLAMLPVDATQTDYLYSRLLAAEPAQIMVIRDALIPRKDSLSNKLWRAVETPEIESQRIRAAAALASYDPDSANWAKVQESVANDLVAVPAVYLSFWMEALRPVRSKLVSPLSAVYRDVKRRETERSLATDLLAQYAADQLSVLAELLMDANEQQFGTIHPKFKEVADQGLPLLREELDRRLPKNVEDDAREKLAKRQANAAVALLRMNQSTTVWPFLKYSADPRLRSYLIHRIASLDADSDLVIKQLAVESDVTIRRALIQCLGEYRVDKLSQDARNAMLPTLQDMYCTASDPGLRASAEWLLRTWRQDTWLKHEDEKWSRDAARRESRLKSIQGLLSEQMQSTPPQWYVNGEGQTMVVIAAPLEFTMGSPSTEAGRQEDELQHRVQIHQTFAIAAKPVTVEQFRRFDKDYEIPPQFTRMENLPVVTIDWSTSARYCNWLSEREGLAEEQFCYEINGSLVRLKSNHLSLRGYRLPSEAEIEYATRAKTTTCRFFGETDDLLPKYAWFLMNSQTLTWPVGSLKPNDLGLFDMLGNANTWCQDVFHPYTDGADHEPMEDGVENARVVRGGSFTDNALLVRSAYRNYLVPTSKDSYLGFRVARTF